MGKAAVIFGVIIGILVLIVAVVIIVIALKGSGSNNSINLVENKTRIFLKAVDLESKIQIESNVLIKNEDNSEIYQGNLDKSGITELSIAKGHNYSIYCWNNDYYSGKLYLSFSETIAESLNKVCTVKKIDKNISVISNGDLSHTLNRIVLHVSTQDWISKMKVCNSCSTGVI